MPICVICVLFLSEPQKTLELAIFPDMTVPIDHFLPSLLAHQHPTWVDRVTYWHVHDLDQTSAENALAQLEHLVRQFIQELKEESIRGD